MATLSKRLGLNRVSTQTIAVTAILWSLVVFGVLVWQAILYRGIVANIGEWQFATFRKYFPFATILLLFTVLTAPLYAILLRRVRRRAKLELKFGKGNSVTVARAQFWKTWLIIVTALLVGASLAVIGHAFTISSAGEKPLEIAVGPAAKGDPGDGPRLVSGIALNDRMAVYTENYIFARRIFAVVPVVGANSDGKRFTYFAQVDPASAGAPAPVRITGFLRQERLPGALRTLYQQAGFEISQPAWILYRDVAAARWTHLRIAGVIALFAMVIGFFALRQTRKLQKLRDLAK